MPNKSYHDLVREAKGRVREVTPRETIDTLQKLPGTVIVDCREPNEFALGHIPGAVFIPRGLLEQNIERAVPRDRKVIIYCASGNRSALAADVLAQMGYADVASMSGGIRGWVDAGGDIAG
jgi:adenylyltransferase/sulfurtransferase